MTDLITSSVPAKTMTSLDLLAIINQVRAAQGLEPLRRNDFHNKVADELEGLHYETFVVKNDRGSGPSGEAYHLTQDQALLVAMRESKHVRRNVLAKLRELEAAVQKQTVTLDTTPRHSVLDMWRPLNGGRGRLPKALIQSLETLRRAYPASVERDKVSEDYLVATFLALATVETLSKYREDKLSRVKNGLETSDQVWLAFANARDELRGLFRSGDEVSGLLH